MSSANHSKGINLYVHFKAPALESYKVPSHLKKQVWPVLVDIRTSGMTLREQQRITVELITALYQPDADADALMEKAREKCASAKTPWYASIMDVMLFVPLWIGIVQVLVNTVMQAISSHQPIPSTMSWSLGDLLGALAIYLVVKLLLELITRYNYGWRRWLIVFGGLILLLFAGLASRIQLGVISVSPWTLLLVCAVVFALGLGWHKQVYGEEKHEPRIQ